MTDPPKPRPKGMSVSQALRVSLSDEWRESSKLVCNICDSPAYLNPYMNDIMGCKKCGFVSSDPVRFRKKAKSWRLGRE